MGQKVSPSSPNLIEKNNEKRRKSNIKIED